MEPSQVLVPGLQTVKESEVGTRIHQLAKNTKYKMLNIKCKG